MTEKQILSQEKEQQALQASPDAEKANAQAVFELDATLHATKKMTRLQALRVSTDNIETQVSEQNKTVIHEAKAGESIDV